MADGDQHHFEYGIVPMISWYQLIDDQHHHQKMIEAKMLDGFDNLIISVWIQIVDDDN